MFKNLLICFVTLLGLQSGTAQNTTGKIIDSETGESLSYASIIINDKENFVSNAEGYFTLSEKYTDEDMLNISFLGYKSAYVSVGELKKTTTVRLQPGSFELETVYVSNIKVNADSIMANVKRNLSRNYKNTDKASRKMLFYREGITYRPVKLKAEMTDATRYNKKEVNEANIELKAFTSKLIANPPQEFTDMLCNTYGVKKIIKEKPVFITKFEVVKAVKLKDKSQSVSLNEVEKMASGVLFKHLDATKNYRIKSGLFGTQDTVVSYNSFYESKKFKTDKSKLNSARYEVSSFVSGNNLQSSKLDFITKPELYEYSYEGVTQSGKDEFIYRIRFSPKKRKGKYAGTLYVSEKDYAVIRTDFVLGEGKTLGGVNLKFLLGIKQSENVSRGTLIFKENPSDSGYYLQYGSKETGEYIYINRPLKFVEIGNGDKDKVAFDLKVEANMLEKKEYFAISESAITEADFDNVKPTEFDYLEIDSYDPAIWKEYTTIEPLKEMKQFGVAE